MEIEFSPNQLTPTPANRPVKGAPGPSGPAQSTSLQGMAELQRKLNELALTRPDKTDTVQQALSDVKYPPDQLLNGIAHLLAIKLTQ
jgi:hypothetical protein